MIFPLRASVFWPWGRFLLITTSEKKTGLLLIEVFEKQFNPHDYGHLVTGGRSYLSGLLVINLNFLFPMDQNQELDILKSSGSFHCA
jgi:hypothetical protein